MGHKGRRQRIRRRSKPGAAPGTLVVDPGALKPEIVAMAWGADRVHESQPRSAVEAAALRERYPLVWIDVQGLGDAELVAELGQRFGLHALWLEDVLNAHQRPKVSAAGDVRFVVLRALTGDGALETEQVSLFVGPGFVVSFQERPCEALDEVRRRARAGTGRLRQSGSDYLCYALLDAVVDGYFPWLEKLGERLDALEHALLVESRPGGLAQLHEVRRELLLVRRAVWPLREPLHELVRDEDALFRPETRVFLSDVYDHTLQVLDLVENDREIAGGLVELHLLGASTRLNEVIKVLTVISTVFIPLTFVVGVYGMNFDPDAGPWSMPELRWPWGYVACMAGLVAMGLGLLAWFWHKGWILAGEKRRGIGTRP
jgi:magnesium transporter